MKSDNIKIKVSNLGPIADASISLKPLTIFIGPNNAGKSYLAIFIYALLNCMSPLTKRRYFIRRFSFFNNFKEKIDENWINNFFKYIEKKVETKKHPVIKLEELSDDVKRPLWKMIRSFLPIFAKLLKEEMERCYGCELSSLIRIPSKQNKIEISISQPFCNFNFIYDKKQLKLEKIEEDLDNLEFDIPHIVSRELHYLLKKGHIPRIFLEEILSNIIIKIFNELIKRTFYLPAARSGILQTHKQLASVTMKLAPRAGIEYFEVPPFSGPVGDFIASFLDISTYLEQEIEKKKIFYKEARILEKEILKGSIETIQTEKILYPEIYYNQENVGKFPLYRTSSMVSELAPLILYLKYFINEESILIIEEPESHLHPGAQLTIAKLLSKLVRKNLHLIITTHSDYLLEQINNLIQKSNLVEKRKKQKGFIDIEYLNPEEVGAYLFRFEPAKLGYVVDELEINKEDGIIEEEFAKVYEALSRESAILSNSF